ncbi:MAG: hypothetical protein DRH76_09485 [Deltaproteobacteria bacterium]|nr:MAG: hypothetical protein DRH76_09485 [Deltaproteobacteria bacterium]
MSEVLSMTIKLPDGSNLSEADLLILRTACEALVAQTCQPGADSPGQVRAMADEGWRVQSGLTWIARAERERESEEAVGETRGEALCRLCQLTGLHAVDGCP